MVEKLSELVRFVLSMAALKDEVGEKMKQSTRDLRPWSDLEESAAEAVKAFDEVKGNFMFGSGHDDE